ncbi:hypothetical protein [Desulfovibrio sp. ZJ369]|nr:hypothetical protein [Desulfovibrio sp. ZJ369]
MNLSLPDTIDDILDAGMDDHISRPFDVAVPRKKPSYWLSRH